jgi:hypothetical protein
MEQPTGELIERMVRLEDQQAELRRANRRLRLVTGALAGCGKTMSFPHGTI